MSHRKNRAATAAPLSRTRPRRGMTSAEIAALWASFEGQGDSTASAADDLLAGRR